MLRILLSFLCLIFTMLNVLAQDTKKIGEVTLSEEVYSNTHVLTATIDKNAFVVFVKSEDQKGFLVCYNKLVEEQWKVPLGEVKNMDVYPYYLPQKEKLLVFMQEKSGGKHTIYAQFFNPKDGKEATRQLLIKDQKKELSILPSIAKSHFLITDHSGKAGNRNNHYMVNDALEVLYNKSISNDEFTQESLAAANNGNILVVGTTKEGTVLLDTHDQTTKKRLLEIPVPAEKKNYLVQGKVAENNGIYYLPVYEEVRKVGILQMMVGIYDETKKEAKILKSEYFFPRYLNKILVNDFRGTKPTYSEKGYLHYKGVLGLSPETIVFDHNDSFYVISEVFSDGRSDLIREVPNDRNYNYSNKEIIKAKEVLITAFANGVNSWNKLIYRFGYHEIRKVVEKGKEAVASSFSIHNNRLMFIIPDQDEYTHQNCTIGAIDKTNGQLIFRERFFHSKRDHLVSKNLMSWLSPANVVLFNCSSDSKTNFYLTSFDFSEYMEW